MQQITDLLTGLQIASQTRSNLINSAIILIVMGALRHLIVYVLLRRMSDQRTRYRWRKTTTYTLMVVAILLIGRIWTTALGSVATTVGIASAGLAIALRDPISNLVGWVHIVWQRPFQVGDRIQIGDLQGDVIDLGILQFMVIEIGNWVPADQSTGRIVHVPNGLVFTQPVENYTEGFDYIWDEIGVTITFESNWKRAKEILTEIVWDYGETETDAAERHFRRASHRYMLLFKTLTPIVYTSVRENGILLSMRYLTAPRRRRTVQADIWEAVLTAFAKTDDINYAYPTQRFYQHAVEGKPDMRPPAE